MGTEIRKIQSTDRPQVRDLADRLTEGVAPWRKTSDVAQAVRSWIDDSSSSDFDGVALVAIDDNEQVIGFVSLSTITHFAGELDAYIGELVVAHEAEGRGVGTDLVAAAEHQATLDGRRCITLTTGAANGRALHFYRRLGYRDEDIKLTKVLSS
ncbi:MAG: GNAT family N-acetyltransferase [Actinomycetota bacterium]